MRYQILGESGLRVSNLCLGTMTFGDPDDWGTGARDSEQLMDRFFDVGGKEHGEEQKSGCYIVVEWSGCLPLLE